MKTRNLLLVTGLSWFALITNLHAQGTAFTYQGRLNDGANPANGKYDLTFAVFSVSNGVGQVGSTVTNPATVVSSGLFTVTLDFGGSVFTGSNRWLEIGVRTNGAGGFITLNARQQLTPTPHAIFAENVGAGGLVAGTYGNAVTLNNSANSFSGNGGGLSNVNAATVGGLSASNFWQLGGNSGVNAASQFLGTTDARQLNLRANNRRVMAFTEGTNTANTLRAVNVLGGSEVNSIAPGVVGGTIAGGGLRGLSVPDGPNEIDGDFGSIGGGSGNFIDAFRYAAIGGGSGNSLQGNFSVIAGGSGNNVQSDYSLIGGGQDNYIFGQYATMAGGHLNQVSADHGSVVGGEANAVNASHAFVGGGGQNTAGGFYSSIGGGIRNTTGSDYGVVAGGRTNTATGPYTFIGGGQNNKASDFFGSVAGGEANNISAGWATIGGGSRNLASAQMTTIGGGDQNYTAGTWATVGGGLQNWATGLNSVVGGGYLNQTAATYSMVPGGYDCYSGGIASFAAGYRAVSGFNGSFVWSDYSAEQDFTATAANQFCIRAQNGIVVESFGNVAFYTGVGTTDPGRYLQLLNSPKAPSASGLKAGGVLVADSFGYANPGKNDLVVKGTLGVGYPNPAPYTMAVNGSVYALSGYSSSDARYKTNITTLPQALATILSLRGVSFEWRKNEFKDINFPSGRQLGFIAQEVEEVLPELVMTDKLGYRGLAYSSIIPILVEGMKEQQAQILAQRKKIQELEHERDGRMNDLQSQIDELKKVPVAHRPGAGQSQGN